MTKCRARRARPLVFERLWTTAVCVALATACSRESASAKRDTAQGATAGDAPATIAIISAADWIGSEWSEDAIYVGLQEEGLK